MRETHENGSADQKPAPALGSLEEQFQALLAVAGQDSDLQSVLGEAQALQGATPVGLNTYEADTYRFALGGNIEARL